MKDLKELLSGLSREGVKVWAEGERLRFSGPKGSVTPEMRAELVARKSELLEFFSSASRAMSDSLPAITRLPRNQGLPLSFAQERVWFLDQLEGKSPEYNIPAALRLEGPLDVNALSRSLDEIVTRHEVLRAFFPAVDGSVAQVIAPALSIPMPVIDLRHLAAPERADELRRLADEEAQLPFDLAAGPMMRAQLLTLGDESHVLLLTMHHIVSDGWSLGVLFGELGSIYGAFSRGEPSSLSELRIQYADFAAWQRTWLAKGELERQLRYWKRQLSGAPSLLRLPSDRPRPPIQGFRGAMEHFVVEAEITGGLKRLSEQFGATLYMTLLAIFVALLSRYSGERDIVVGSPIANRTLTDIEALIGFFVNTLLVRAQLTREMTFGQLLANVREAALEAYAHQDLPFEKLVAELQPERSLSYSPLFQVMFVMQNAPLGKLEMPGLRETALQMDVNVVRCDLTLSMEESGDRLKGLLTYKPELFDASTIERFSRRYQALLQNVIASPDALLEDLDAPRLIAPPPIPALDDVRDEPLSYHQERMWFIDQFETGTVYQSSPVYHNLPLILDLEGSLDVSRLERSINFVIARHEALRTQIESDGDRLFQRILLEFHLPLEVKEVSSGIGSFEHLIDSAIDEVQRPFNLEQEPGVRAKLFSLSPVRNLLVLTIHHILADQQSLEIIAREIGVAYSDLSSGRSPAFPTMPVQYRQVARGERLLSRESLESLLIYWRTQLQGRLQPLELPLDRPRPPVHTYSAGRQALAIDSTLSERLLRVSESERTSIEAVLLAAFKVVLHRYACQDEILVGISDPGRTRAELQQTVGPIANLVALRSDLGGNPGFDKILRRVSRTFEQAVRHRSLPFDQLVRELNPEKDMSRTALFDVLFQFHSRDAGSSISFGNTTASVITTNLGHGKYDLNLSLHQTDRGIEGQLVYNRDFFDSSSIDQLTRHYRAVLNSIAANPTIAIDDIILLSQAEVEEQTIEWNRTEASYPKDRRIHELFSDQVAKDPDATAVICGEESVSYRELDARANRLAHFLRRRGVVRGTLVALCLERSVEMIVSMMGVLKAGAAYLPLDPSHPPDRLRFMVEDSNAGHLVTTGVLSKVIPGFEGEILLLDDATNEMSAMPETAPDSEGDPRDIAYCIYTSGSTGRPKGVLIEHHNVVRLLINDQLPFDFRASDVWTMFHSYCFDFSVWELFGALLYGGRLIVVAAEVTRDPALFLDLLVREQVTVLNQTPAAFYSVAREALAGARRELALRYVIFGGEALHPVQLREWSAAYPGVLLVNMYGITETTVHVTFKQIGIAEIEGNIGNIGRPIPTTTTYVMDSQQRLLPVGVPGEICVGGGGVGRGYLNRDDLTAEKFVENPYRVGERLYRSGDLARLRPNGEMIYMGRLDYQVQIRGFRVELGEIQHRLLSHPLVSEAIVMSRNGAADAVELVAYVLPKAGAVPLMGSNGHADLTNGSARRYRLPNGMEVFHLNRNETDFLYQEIFAEASYLRHGVTLQDGDCVFDVGANIGLFTLFAGYACRDARIFSFEPIPATFEVLRRNAELYSLNAKLFECGLGSESKEEVFTSYPFVSIFSGRFAVPEEEQKIIKSFVMHQQQDAPLSALESAEIDEVLAERMGTQQVVCQLRTLSDVIREQGVERIDLLKIDVEKSELDLLSGIEEQDWAKIEQIVMEVHNVDQRLEGIRELVKSHGFEVTVDQDEWFSDTSNHNLYAVKPTRKQSTAGREVMLPRAVGGHLIDELRSHLKQSLPDYMIPSAIVLLDAVPRTSNGKVDYKRLPAADGVTRAGERVLVAPRTQQEQQVLEIWRNVLGVEQIGVNESFFEVGGHSLLATQVISRLRDAVGVSLPVRVLFESPTIAGLAEAIEKAAAEGQQSKGPALVRLSREAQTRSSLGLRSKG